MAMDDSFLRTRPGLKGRLASPGGIVERSRREGGNPEIPAPPAPSAGPEQPGPESFDPESRDYKAHGFVDGKPVPTLRFILKDRSERAFSYAHLDSAYPGGCEFIPSAPGKGNLIKLRFAGHSKVIMVIIEGVRLRRTWELIMNHQTPWVHELPADVDFEGNDAPVIKSFTFEAVKE